MLMFKWVLSTVPTNIHSPAFVLPFIPHTASSLDVSVIKYPPISATTSAAAFRITSQVFLRFEPLQQKVWVVFDWVKQKQGRPFNWGESSTLQPTRGMQERGFTSWKSVGGGVSESCRKQVVYTKVDSDVYIWKKNICAADQLQNVSNYVS